MSSERVGVDGTFSVVAGSHYKDFSFSSTQVRLGMPSACQHLVIQSWSPLHFELGSPALQNPSHADV